MPAVWPHKSELPDPNHPERGNIHNLNRSRAYFLEAVDIFQRFGESAKVLMTNEIVTELDQELGDTKHSTYGESTHRNTM